MNGFKKGDLIMYSKKTKGRVKVLNIGDLGVIVELIDARLHAGISAQIKIYFFRELDLHGQIRYLFSDEVEKVSA